MTLSGCCAGKGSKFKTPIFGQVLLVKIKSLTGFTAQPHALFHQHSLGKDWTGDKQCDFELHASELQRKQKQSPQTQDINQAVRNICFTFVLKQF